MILRKCAWCGKLLGIIVRGWGGGFFKYIGTTHGICEKCSKKQLKEIKTNEQTAL